MALDIYYVALVGINALFVAMVISNALYFRRATKAPRIARGPFVSVIVPARDEAHSIGRCLESLLAQEYGPFEVIVVDDESTDATARIVAEIGALDARVRLVSGGQLPDQWLGKPHALSRGASVARGEILLLTDADTVHTPKSISWAVTNLIDHDADMLSGYLDQEYGSFGERIVVPTMYAAMLLVPFALFRRYKSSQLAFAIGQYVAIRREALDRVGGFESIRDSIIDDMAMARRMKEFGYRGVFLDAKCAARCRLYAGYRDAFDGIKRSVYSAVGARPSSVVAMAAIVLGVIVWPAASALTSAVRLEAPSGPIAAAVVLFTALWAFVTWDRDVPFVAFILYPVVFLNLLAILVASMVETGFGPGIMWKGRLVRVPRRSASQPGTDVAGATTRSGRVR